MELEWKIFIQETVGAQHKIPLPEEVKREVGFEHFRGPSVHFNVEENADFIVLSRRPLGSDDSSPYENLGRYNILNIDSLDEEGGQIRIPKMEDYAAVRSQYIQGTRVNYMAYRKMTEQDNPAVHLITNPKCRKLLPGATPAPLVDDDDGDGGEDLEDALLDVPAFLPST